MNTKTKSKFLIGVSLLAFFALIGLLSVLFTQPERWVGLGLVGFLWFVVLIFLGFLCAVSLFYLFKSYGKYKGKALGGTVELGGPGVLVLMIVGLGFQFAPAPQADFDFTLYVELSDGSNPLKQQGKVKLKLGDNPEVRPIGSQGEVRFNNIAGRFRGQPVQASLQDGFPYQLAESSKSVTLTGESATLKIEPQMAKLSGRVETRDGKAISNVEVRVQDEVTTTDKNGRFSFTLAADMTEAQRLIKVDAEGFRSSRSSFNFTGESITIRLTHASL